MPSLLLAVLGVRILQPRRIAPFDPVTVAPPVLASDARLPRLVVFDLDHTLWTPELYTLRHLPGYDDASPPFPVAGEDVWLIDGAEAVLLRAVLPPRTAARSRSTMRITQSVLNPNIQN